MKASGPSGSDHPPSTHPPGRVCSHPGCDTRLSTYNPATTCYRHDQGPTDVAYYLRATNREATRARATRERRKKENAA